VHEQHETLCMYVYIYIYYLTLSHVAAPRSIFTRLLRKIEANLAGSVSNAGLRTHGKMHNLTFGKL
jgi:hypothetical protein